MREDGPNWPLACGSSLFLLVALIGFMAEVPPEVVLGRAGIAAGVSAALGYMIPGLLRALVPVNAVKGTHVDFRIGAEDPLELSFGAEERRAEERRAEAPQSLPSPPGSDEEPSSTPPAAEFQPLDFSQSARRVQSLMKE